MFNIADLIIVLLILITMFIGYKRGFVKTAFGMMSFVVAIILATSLYKVVAASLIENTEIDNWIYETIAGKVEEADEGDAIQNDASEEPIEEDIEEHDTSLEISLENLPENLKDELGIEEIKKQTKEVIAKKVTDISLNLISFIGIYVITRLVLTVVCFVLDKIMLIPVLKQINEILGLVLGALQGVLRVCIVLAIITLLTSVFNMDGIVSYIKASIITSFLYENNFIIYLLF